MGSISLRANPACCFLAGFFCFVCFFLCLETSERRIFRRFCSLCLDFSLPTSLFSGFRLLCINLCVCRILSKTKAVLCATAFFLLYISRLNLTKKEALRSAQGFRKNRSFVFFDQLAASLTRQPALMMDTCSASSGPVVKEMSSQEPSGRTKMPQIGVSVPSFSRTAGRII